MYMLAKSNDSIIQIFTKLCLSQVKEQLTENLIYTVLNPESFTSNGQLYSFTDNESVIFDETLQEFSIDLTLVDRFN